MVDIIRPVPFDGSRMNNLCSTSLSSSVQLERLIEELNIYSGMGPKNMSEDTGELVSK